MGLFRIGGLSESINIFVESTPSFFITIIPILYQSISVFILSVYVNPLQLGFTMEQVEFIGLLILFMDL